MLPAFNFAYPAAIALSIFLSASICARITSHNTCAKSSKFHEIDGLRGLAAVLVVLNHMPTSVFGIIDVLPPQWGLHKEDWWTFANFGTTGVRIFFCITGFLFWQQILSNDMNVDWGRFYLRRIARIFPAYFVFATTVTIIAMASSDFSLKVPVAQLAHEIFQQFSFGMLDSSHVNGMRVTFLNAVAWTLAYEWKFYVALPLLVAVRSNKFLSIFAIAILLFWSLFYDMSYYFLLLFLAGMLSAELLRWIPRIEVRFANAAILVLLIASIFVDYLSWNEEIRIVYVVLLTFAIFVCAVFARPSLLRARLVVFIGAISYSLYLMHLITMQVILHAIAKISPLANWTMQQYLAYGFVAASLAVLVATAAYHYIEAPFMAAATKRKHERGTSVFMRH
ncbi:TPA: acyltransferase [Burkholderia vietnamiensis]|nr:acyltransferase [Burkholderia vietnamiensis]